MAGNIYKQSLIDRIIDLSAESNNKQESTCLLRNMLFEDTNGGKLYKYRRFDDKGRSISIVENQTMYCSRPSDFNDPFDCKIAIDLESIIDALCGQEIVRIQSIFDKYVNVVQGKRCIEDFSSTERELIQSLLDNEVFNYLIRNKSLKTDDEITEYVQSHPEILSAVMDPLLNISGIKEKYPLIDAQMDGVLNKYLWNGLQSVTAEKSGLTAFLKAQGITADVDQISMARLWAEGMNDAKLSTSAAQMEELLKRLEMDVQEKLNNSFYVGSLAADYKNRLMWSHYADEHRGFCIEFDFSKASEDCLPLPVIYSNKRVKMPWIPTQDPSKEEIRFMTETFMKALITKDFVWEYEHEWRMLISAGDDRFVNMPPISCVYIGAQCSDDNKQKLMDVAQEKGIPIKQMVLDRGEYELHAVEC